MNPDLIPSYDMLGLPAPAWLVQVLMALTLSLHWLFLGGVVGGLVVVVANQVRAKRDPSLAGLNRGLVSYFPFILSMAMTIGVAPLLFVQVLYGQFFYTANIMLGWWWLALVGLVIVNFYLLWFTWHRLQGGRTLPWVAAIVALVLFAKAATILSSNATLVQSPAAWEAVRAGGMNRLYTGDGSLFPRILFALSGFVAVGGLVVAVLDRSGILAREEAPEGAAPAGLALVLPALLVQAVCGILVIVTLPSVQRSAALAGGFEAVFSYVAILAFGGAAALTFLARQAAGLKPLLLPLLAYFVGLLSLAAARDAVRRAALKTAGFSIADAPFHPEWSSLALFLVAFVAGLGVLAWLVRLATQRDEPAIDAES